MNDDLLATAAPGEYRNKIREQRFNPYEGHGGTVVAIAGEDFAVIGADTRLSIGFNILSRDHSKIYTLGNKVCVGSSGFHGDVLTVKKLMQMKWKIYKQEHGTEMTVDAFSHMLSRTLYYRRFFPYYVGHTLVGLDEEGKPAVYSYDSIGSVERTPYIASGNGASLLMPLLDSFVGNKNTTTPGEVKFTRQEAVSLVRDIFISAAERDIHTGDGVEIMTLDKNGIDTVRHPLRED